MEISEKDIEYLKYMERTDLFYRAMPKDITDEKNLSMASWYSLAKNCIL